MLRLKPFFYIEPASLSEAIGLLVKKGKTAFPIAGGTDLLVRMKRSELFPSTLVNLKRIDGMQAITDEHGDGVRIGALTTIAAIESSHKIMKTHPIMIQAAKVLGSPPIRQLATIGGNIARASPAADLSTPLLVLNAYATTEGPSGINEYRMDNIFAGPGRTALSAGEIITSFMLPKMQPRSAAVYLKIGRRAGMDCALIGVAAMITLDEDYSNPLNVRIALAACGPVPFRAKMAEKAMMCGPVTENRIVEASEAALLEASPIDDLRADRDYRIELIRVLTKRAITAAFAQAKGGKPQ